jgi:hypothetical protein
MVKVKKKENKTATGSSNTQYKNTKVPTYHTKNTGGEEQLSGAHKADLPVRPRTSTVTGQTRIEWGSTVSIHLP